MIPKIGVDLDGVVYNWGDTVRYLIKHYHGIDLPPSTHWNFIEQNIPESVWDWLWTEGIELGMFKYGNTIKGSIEGLREIAGLGELEIITHRPRQAMKDTQLFIYRLPDVFDGIHILTKQEPKSGVGCDIYIDDNPQVIEDVVRNGSYAILLDQPWNQEVRNIFGGLADAFWVRAYGWEEVPKLLHATVAEWEYTCRG